MRNRLNNIHEDMADRYFHGIAQWNASIGIWNHPIRPGLRRDYSKTRKTARLSVFVIKRRGRIGTLRK